MANGHRFGRPLGDHGTANDAIEFALDHLDDDVDTFLRSWRTGDLAEYPDYYIWLKKEGR